MKLHYMDPDYDFSNIVINTIDRYNNIFLFLERDEKLQFQETGRIHNLEESKEIDKKLKILLDEYGYDYKSINTYSQSFEEIVSSLDLLIENMKDDLKNPEYKEKQVAIAKERELKALLSIINRKTIKTI